MTTQKKGWYYYVITALCFLHIVLTATAIWALKHLWDNGQLMTDYVSTLKAVFTICVQFWFIGEMLWHDSGYTIITTTEYKLFKCKESGKEEAFMMFADSTEELEYFFEVTEPTKKIYIEEAEMTGKSIQMKVFNRDKEDVGGNK